ncbi:cocaine- and amphetamine-regulated transcript protein-like [Hyperolius riggenbachi]|uniref:cocaine- and amphetamine-regulated transcript protein-like n=1 Tax=Hyperolius riggenbachi TaxID=752182 RepID=UPI0035A34B0A
MRMSPCVSALYLCLIAALLTNLTSWRGDCAELPANRASQRINEKDLLLELQDVLDKLQSRRGGAWEAKLNQMPKCIIGDSCAVKRGARIGKLCDCPRRSTCNFFFLKCL